MTTAKLFEVVLIETRNTCTRRCWFCKFGQERQDSEIVEMDWRTIERIVYNLKDLNYAGRISWFWINEPLLERRIYDIIRFTREQCPRAFQSLITNGDLLDDRVSQKLFDSGLDGLRVSVYDEKAFARISPMQNKRLRIYDMRNPDEKLENRGTNIKTNVKLFERKALKRMENNCARPFQQLVINPNGKIVLCCSDMYSDVVMGDTRKERLEEIWYNEKFEQYRRSLEAKGRRGLKLCDGCSFAGSPSPVYLPFESRPVELPVLGE